MPAKKRRDAMSGVSDEERSAVAAQERSAQLPDGYNGPAYQLHDGRVIYIGLYLGRVYAMLYNDDHGQPCFYKNVQPVSDCRDESAARTALIEYAQKHHLEPV